MLFVVVLNLFFSADWSDVYGSVPQSIINVEKDTISSLIQSKIELVSNKLDNADIFEYFLQIKTSSFL